MSILGTIRRKVMELSGERLDLSVSIRDDETSGWFSPYWKERELFHLEFNWWTHFCQVGIEFDDGRMELKWALPPLAVWFHIPIGYDAVEKITGEKYRGREIELSIHDWKLWWQGWARTNEWRSADPWWMNQTFELNLLTLFFGEVRRLGTEVVREKQVKVRMPEKEYDATVKIVRDTWGRKRWPRWPFAKKSISADWECKEGIPHPGKGTMSYNCGEDALMGGGFHGENNIPRAIGRIIGDVLYYRDRYPL